MDALAATATAAQSTRRRTRSTTTTPRKFCWRRRQSGYSSWILTMMTTVAASSFAIRRHGGYSCCWGLHPSFIRPSSSSVAGSARRRPRLLAWTSWWSVATRAPRRDAAAFGTMRIGGSRRMMARIEDPASMPSSSSSMFKRPRSFSTFLPTGGGSSYNSNSSLSSSNADTKDSMPSSLTSHRHRWSEPGGFEHSSTEFATHVVVEQDEPMALSDLVDQVLEGRDHDVDAHTLSGAFLIELGAVWHLPSDGPKSPHLGGKPTRIVQPDFVISKGDYVRIHHNPRRFPNVHRYDWAARYLPSMSSKMDDAANAADTPRQRPGVIVAENETSGFLVINKPMRVPVHMTVDNCRENVQHCLKEAQMKQRQRKDDGTSDCYVSTPQRLDQNTSGLLVVATSKAFATYFADLLKFKTHQHIEGTASDTSTTEAVIDTTDSYTESTSVHKLYRCLVCLSPDLAERDTSTLLSGESVLGDTAALRRLADSGQLLKHYLEPSIRAPKRFVREVPRNFTSTSMGSWQECLSRLRKVGPVYPLVGNEPGQALAEALWPSSGVSTNGQSTSSTQSRRPPNVQAVVELEVELLTGRTHQIRGQLSQEGFPIVGDAQYGGAIASDAYGGVSGDDQLALQCCQLEFVDPDVFQKQDGSVDLKRSNRWNRFRLDDAWWTPHLKRYTSTSSMLSDELKTSNDTVEISDTRTEARTESSLEVAKPHLLPTRVSLSPGRNKYVLVRARHRIDADADEEWFVKSAKPDECGGPYHGNVAQDLREWIEAAGYEASVTGGGRIYYRPDENCAIVYGFSYAFGRGNHNKAAELIRRSGIYATVDSSPDLY